MSDAARHHRVTVAFGPETHDAWRAGISPDAYARQLAATQEPRRTPGRHPPADGRTAVDIAWYVVPNKNQRAGGYMPMYRIDGGRERGDTHGRGYDLETARRLAREEAQEEARRYVGDWRVTVRPADLDESDVAAAATQSGSRRIEQEVKAVVRGDVQPPLVGFETAPGLRDVAYRWAPSGRAVLRRTRTGPEAEYHVARPGDRGLRALRDWAPWRDGHPAIALDWEPLTYQQARQLLAHPGNA